MAAIILKLLNKEHLNIKASSELFFQLFTNQSSDLLMSYENILKLSRTNKHMILILLIILLFSILIINQQFNNALLDIYFLVKPLPMVNSFYEVCNNLGYSVKTTVANTFANRLDEVCNLEVKKRPNFEIVYAWTDFINEEILLDVINGKTVLISHSSLSKNFKEIFELKTHIISPDDGRNPTLLCYIIDKNLPNWNQFYFL